MYLDTGNMYLHGSLSSLLIQIQLFTFYKTTSSALSLTVKAITDNNICASCRFNLNDLQTSNGNRNRLHLQLQQLYPLKTQKRLLQEQTNNTGGNLISFLGCSLELEDPEAAGTVSIKARAVEAIAIGGSGELGFYSGSTPQTKQTVLRIKRRKHNSCGPINKTRKSWFDSQQRNNK